MLDRVHAVLDRIEAQQQERVIEARSALELLQSIYRDPTLPLPARMKAAVEALPFEHPKLSAMAVTSMSGKDFAAQLERAISRSTGRRLIEAKALPQPD
jgi:hypothetical protein